MPPLSLRVELAALAPQPLTEPTPNTDLAAPSSLPEPSPCAGTAALSSAGQRTGRASACGLLSLRTV
eukprot:6191045-Pleurochrysis_carterae.AAC.5